MVSDLKYFLLLHLFIMKVFINYKSAYENDIKINVIFATDKSIQIISNIKISPMQIEKRSYKTCNFFSSHYQNPLWI